MTVSKDTTVFKCCYAYKLLTHVLNAFRHLVNYLATNRTTLVEFNNRVFYSVFRAASSVESPEVSQAFSGRSISPFQSSTDSQLSYLYRKSCLDLIIGVSLIANDATRKTALGDSYCEAIVFQRLTTWLRGLRWRDQYTQIIYVKTDTRQTDAGATNVSGDVIPFGIRCCQ